MKSRNEIDDRVLVIAYGNPIRSDDGVAWHAAEEIRRKLESLVEVICVHQLTPELAEEISRVSTVIFVDAARDVDPGKVVCRPVCQECTPNALFSSPCACSTPCPLRPVVLGQPARLSRFNWRPVF